MSSFRPSSLAARSRAFASCAFCAFSSSARRPSKCLMFSGVARFALPCGMRKLRAKPSFTFTTSPRLPRFATFSIRMTCMAPSVQVGVGQQREEARALDGVGQLALVAGGGAGDARRDDLAGLVDEVLQDLDVLVVDPLDLLGGEAAELAAAEQRPLALVLLVLAELPFAFAFTSARRRHAYSPSMNSMFVTCSTSLLERLLFALRKPWNFALLPRGLPMRSLA